MDRNCLLTPDKEKQRYIKHNNNVDDPGYQQFVAPLTKLIFESFMPHHKGLDFGSGTGPVISKILSASNYQIYQYDPFFSPNNILLKQRYDYIVCCEVVEHFHNPSDDFSKLYNMLKPRGELICQTSFLQDIASFDKWYYKNDPTHCFFYSKQSVEYIYKQFNFSELRFYDKIFVLKK